MSKNSRIRKTTALNGGVKTCQCGGAKAGHLARQLRRRFSDGLRILFGGALERAALIWQAGCKARWLLGQPVWVQFL